MPSANDLYTARIALTPVSGGTGSFDCTGNTFTGGEPWSGAINRTGWYTITPTGRRIFRFRITSAPAAGQVIRAHFYRDTGTLGTLQSFEYDYSYPGTDGGDPRIGSFNPQFIGWVTTDSSMNVYREYQLTAETIAIQIGPQLTTTEGVIGFEWQEQTPPANDDWSAREIITGTSGSTSGTTEGATWDTALWGTNGNAWPQYTDYAQSNPWAGSFSGTSYRMKGVVWYSFTPDVTGVYEITATPTGSATDIFAAIFEGATYAGLTLTAWAGKGDSISYELIGGVEYSIAVAALNLTAASGLDHTLWRGPFDLTWELTLPPDNDLIGGAEVLSGDSGTATLHTLAGAWSEPEAYPNANAPSGLIVDQEVWYRVTPATSGWFTFDLGSYFSPGNTYLIQMRQTEDLTYVDDVFGSLFGTPGTSPMRTALRAGEEYTFMVGRQASFYPKYFHVDDPDFTSFDWAQYASGPAANDDFEDAEVITGASGTVSGDTDAATFQASEAEQLYYRPTLWYSWTCPADGFYRFTNDGDGTDIQIAVYTGISLADLEGVAYNDDGLVPYGSGECQVAFHASSGTTYYLQVGTWNFNPANPTAFTLTWGTATPPAHETFATADTLPSVENQASPLAFSALGADITLETAAPAVDPNGDGSGVFGHEVWHKWTAPRTSPYAFTFNIPSWSSFVTIYRQDGTTAADLVWFQDAEISYDDAYVIDTHQEAGPDFGDPLIYEEGVTYYFRIVGESYATTLTGGPADPTATWTCDSGDYEISWTRTPYPPANDNLDGLGGTGAVGNLSFGYPDPHYDYDTYGYDYFRSSGGLYEATNFDATAVVGEPATAGFAAARTVWFYWQAPSAGTFRFWLESDELTDMVMSVYSSPSFFNETAPGTLVTSDDDSGAGNMPQVEFAATQFADYTFHVDSKDNPGGNFVIKWTQVTVSPPANNDWANAEEIVGETGTISGTTVNANAEPGEPSEGGTGPHASVWYVINSPVDRGVTLQITAAGTFPQIASISVWEGDSLADLVEPNAADFYNPTSSGGVTDSWEYQITAGVPLYVRVMSTNNATTTFDLDYDLSSLTPPSGDDFGTPIDSGTGSGDTAGDTEGATVDPNEPDYEGTVPFGLKGTVWHRFVPDYDGVYRIAAERPDGDYYQFSVWRGETLGDQLEIVPGNQTTFGGALQNNAFVLRAGETYRIRVERWAGDTWGPYTLHVNAFPEYDDWVDSPGGYDSLTGSASWSPPTFPETTGGVLTCSGATGYGTVEPWGPSGGELSGIRWQSLRFKMRVTGGEVMYREGFGNALGVLRLRNSAGATIGQIYLKGNRDGTNSFQWTGQVGEGVIGGNTTLSFGSRGRDHNEWVDVEITFVTRSGVPGFGGEANPSWSPQIAVNGNIVMTSQYYFASDAYAMIGRSRYFDFGAYSYPTGRNSQQEPHDTWTIEFKDVTIRGRPTLGSIPSTDVADQGIVAFDGWGHGEKLDNVQGTNAAVVDAPGLPVEGKDWADWKAVRFQSPGSDNSLNAIATQTWLPNPKPWVGFWLYFEEWPNAETHTAFTQYFAGFGTAGEDDGIGSLWITTDGELRLAASRTKQWIISDCVAHLNLQTWYWVEMECDASMWWDAHTRISINGVSMGDFSFSRPWAEIKAVQPDRDGGSVRGFPLTATAQTFTLGKIGSNRSSISYGSNTSSFGSLNNEHYYGAHLCYGRAAAYPKGALQTQLLPGVNHDADGTHGFPTLPADHQYLHTADRPNIWLLYGYDVKADSAEDVAYKAWSYPPGGAISIVADAGGPPETSGYTAIKWEARNPILYPGGEAFGSYMGPRLGYFDHSLYTNAGGGKTGHCAVVCAWVRGEGTLGRLIIGDWVGGTDPGISSTSYTLTGTHVQHWCATLNSWALLTDHATQWTEGDWDFNDIDSVMYWKRPRILNDPLLYPRFATSSDDGATWTWLTDPTATGTNAFIGDDVSAAGGTGIWLDNAAALERIFESQEGAVLPNWAELSSVGYHLTAHYLEYALGDPPVDGSMSYNLLVRGGGYNYTPATGDRTTGSMFAQIVDSTHRRPLLALSVPATPGVARSRVPTDASGGHWDNSVWTDTVVRFGFYRGYGQGSVPATGLSSSPTSYSCTQLNGTILYAAQWEALVQAEPGDAAAPCGIMLINSQLIRRS